MTMASIKGMMTVTVTYSVKSSTQVGRTDKTLGTLLILTVPVAAEAVI